MEQKTMKKGKINNSGSYTFTMLRRYGEFWNKDVELIGINGRESAEKTGFFIPILAY